MPLNASCQRKAKASIASAVLATKKPYSGARIGPRSRSAGKNEKLPESVRTVTIVRLASSILAWPGQTGVSS